MHDLGLDLRACRSTRSFNLNEPIPKSPQAIVTSSPLFPVCILLLEHALSRLTFAQGMRTHLVCKAAEEVVYSQITKFAYLGTQKLRELHLSEGLIVLDDPADQHRAFGDRVVDFGCGLFGSRRSSE